jgi:hypothetical protein
MQTQSRARFLTTERCLVWAVALLTGGAAAIHFGVMGEHAGVSWTHGLFFAVVGWLQIAAAGALVLKPSRQLLIGTALLNLAVIGVWVVSRTIGISVGGETGPESVEFIDGLCAAFEAAAVLVTLPALARSFGRRPLSASVGFGSVTLVGVAVATLTSISFSPAVASAGGDGHNHSHGATEVAADGHSHSHGTPTGPAGLVKTPAGTIVTGALTGDTPCERSGPPASEGQVGKDAEGHNHRGPLLQSQLTREETMQLQEQQAIARAVALKYPTVADAERAGYAKSTPYVPCIGAHYTNARLAGRFDVGAPSELLYDGTNPDSRVVGLSYLVFHPGGAPDGFAGPNDRWHTHSFNGGLCLKGGVVVGNEATTQAECKARGGSKAELKDVWMVHDWVVPGFECSWGVFAGECPELGGRVGGTAWDGEQRPAKTSDSVAAAAR